MMIGCRIWLVVDIHLTNEGYDHFGASLYQCLCNNGLVPATTPAITPSAVVAPSITPTPASSTSSTPTPTLTPTANNPKETG
jgi:hypothetical protein